MADEKQTDKKFSFKRQKEVSTNLVLGWGFVTILTLLAPFQVPVVLVTLVATLHCIANLANCNQGTFLEEKVANLEKDNLALTKNIDELLTQKIEFQQQIKELKAEKDGVLSVSV